MALFPAKRPDRNRHESIPDLKPRLHPLRRPRPSAAGPSRNIYQFPAADANLSLRAPKVAVVAGRTPSSRFDSANALVSTTPSPARKRSFSPCGPLPRHSAPQLRGALATKIGETTRPDRPSRADTPARTADTSARKCEPPGGRWTRGIVEVSSTTQYAGIPQPAGIAAWSSSRRRSDLTFTKPFHLRARESSNGL